jgi:DNA-binding response OmpR family regulator
MALNLHAGKNNIAVIEDDESLGRRLCDIVTHEGWKGRWFRRAEAFIEAHPRQRFDAALIDLRLPGMSGLDLLDRLYNKPLPAPVVFMLTGDDRDTTMAEAFARGAHDFLLKPIRARELVARLAAALRRHKPMVAQEPEHVNSYGYGNGNGNGQTLSLNQPTLTVGHVRLESRTQRAFLDGREVRLTSREWALAFFIFQHMNQDLERSLLQEQVFRLNPRVQTRTVDTHLSRLKAKLRLHPEMGFQLRSIYGAGYRLERLADSGVN